MIDSIQTTMAIFKATQDGTAQLLRALLSRAKTANHRDEYGNTPLHMAAGLGRFEAVGVLLEHGYCVNAMNIARQTPLHLAAMSGRHMALSVLLRHKDVDVDRQNQPQRTALHEAVEARSSACVRLLIEAGASATRCDQDGRSPLHFAAHYGDAPILEMLVRVSRLNAQDARLQTALIHAACMGPIGSLKALLDAGANPAVTDENDRNALDWAIALGRNEHVHLLTEIGALMSAPMLAVKPQAIVTGSAGQADTPVLQPHAGKLRKDQRV